MLDQTTGRYLGSSGTSNRVQDLLFRFLANYHSSGGCLLFSSAWLCCGTGICHLWPSPVNSGFSETAAWIQGKFCGKLPIRHISRLYMFLFSKFLIFKFLQFFFVFVNMRPYDLGAKISKRYFSPSFGPNFMTNMIVMGEYRLGLSWRCAKN